MTAPKATGHTATNQSGELNWLLDDLVDRVASIRKALVLSGDGLPTGVSKDLTREDSEHRRRRVRLPQPCQGRGPPLRGGQRPADRRRAR